MIRIYLIALVLSLFSAFHHASAQEETLVGDDWLEPVKPVLPHLPFRRPDLIVSAIGTPIRMQGYFKVSVTVKNIGRASTGNPFYVVLRDNSVGTGPRAQQVGPLTGGQSATLVFHVSAPDEQNICWLSGIVDYGNKVDESNEQNQTKTYYGYWP